MIALLGANGYVGHAFQAYFKSTGTPYINLDRSHTIDASHLAKRLKEIRPSALISCAGFTGKPNVDACELQKTECLYGNAVLPGIIREACERLDLPWGNVSSGCIYTGRASDGQGFKEEAPPNFSFRQNNCSFYSGTKALGEEVLEGASQCYVWRLRIPFDDTSSPRNYLQKLISYQTLLEAENSLSNLYEFTAACHACFLQKLPYGIYNLTNPGSVWSSEVVELIKRSGVSTKKFRFFSSEAEFMQLAAKTPRSNCVLDSSKAIASGLKLTPVQDSIVSMLKSWKKLETRN
jgi:dTDP-4-dehydrorhamnose reductase